MTIASCSRAPWWDPGWGPSPHPAVVFRSFRSCRLVSPEFRHTHTHTYTLLVFWTPASRMRGSLRMWRAALVRARSVEGLEGRDKPLAHRPKREGSSTLCPTSGRRRVCPSLCGCRGARSPPKAVVACSFLPGRRRFCARTRAQGKGTTNHVSFRCV